MNASSWPLGSWNESLSPQLKTLPLTKYTSFSEASRMR